MELFFCCSTVDYLHLHIIVLLCLFGNKMGITNRNPTRMGIRLKLGNGNEKEWELTAWDWRNGNVKIHSRSSLGYTFRAKLLKE